MVLRRNIYRGVYHQRGNGVSSVLSGLFRLLTPFIKRGAKAALKSQTVQKALKSAKKSAIKTASTAASDLIAGRNPQRNAKINLKQAQLNIEKAISSQPKKKKPFKPVKAPKRKIIAPIGFKNTAPSKKSKPLISL